MNNVRLLIINVTNGRVLKEYIIGNLNIEISYIELKTLENSIYLFYETVDK